MWGDYSATKVKKTISIRLVTKLKTDKLVQEEKKKKKKKKERTMEIIIQCQVCLGPWQHDIYLGGLFSLNFNLRNPSDKLSYDEHNPLH